MITIRILVRFIKLASIDMEYAQHDPQSDPCFVCSYGYDLEFSIKANSMTAKCVVKQVRELYNVQKI